MPLLTATVLTEFAERLLIAGGASAEEARIVAESLVGSNLRGHDSHGVVRLPWYLRQLREGELVAGAPLEVLNESPAMLVCDAHLGFGQVQAGRLLEAAITKATQLGVAAATARNVGHIGRLGEYTEAAAQRGLAAFCTVNDNGIFRVVAPPGGTEPRLSTNPLSFAVPTGEEPLVFDASTSVVAQGKVLVHRLDDRPCPEGWLQDAAGEPTTDSHILQADPPGALLPLGGPAAAYKGFGLSVMLDCLVGGLSGGFCPPPQPGAKLCNTVLMTLWNPEFFAGSEHLIQQVRLLSESLHSCPRRADAPPIRLPGEGSHAVSQTRQREGIPLAEGTWDALLKSAERYRVDVPSVE